MYFYNYKKWKKNGKNEFWLCIQSQFGFVHKAKKGSSTSRSWGVILIENWLCKIKIKK